MKAFISKFKGGITITLILLLCSSCLRDPDLPYIEDIQNTPCIHPQVNSRTQYTTPSGIILEKDELGYTYIDDMILTEEQISSLSDKGYLCEEYSDYNRFLPYNSNYESRWGLWEVQEQVQEKSRVHALNPSYYNLWSMVRFVYGDDLTEDIKSSIRTALYFWQGRTNVRFYNATGEPTEDKASGVKFPYIYFCLGSSTSSYIGQKGGKQELFISPYNCSYGTIAHEIGHAIGMIHEHQRYDRDNYIIVNMDNIVESFRVNFQKYELGYNIYCMGDFDFSSIMMYPSFSGYEINFITPSITKLDGTTFSVNRNSLSTNDMKYANTFYLPFVARKDSYHELDKLVYDSNNRRLTEEERLALQGSLNNGVTIPPEWGRIENKF